MITSGSELRSINALSSSTILTLTVRSLLMTLLKKFRCSNTVVPSVMHKPYSYFLRYSLLERLFVINNVSNLDHELIVISSSIILYVTSSARYSWIVFAAFRSISSWFSFDVPAGFADLPCKVLWRPYCTSNAFTLICHKPKFPLYWTSQPRTLS